MKVKGSYAPPNLEFEVIDDGRTALIRFYENVEPYEEPETETTPATSGYTFDRYTITRPYSDELRADIETNAALWLDFVKQQEHERLAAEVRAYRNALLEEIDWTQALDAPVSAASREALRLYRQELRDITERPDFPYITTWPERPVITKDAPDPVDEAFDVLTGGENNA
ncbi:tail fiber assembly protein [Clostridium sp. D33t1_170424_F3]|uniref:tail fiber assembly protein n=1 Tax=Clostridium sp. D33t1_170424_F3 TaxID=2787099 RepID=UPI0018AAA624|nr:tail fiber assembly protein [Clostridium sp. D33t1_170424_F3]